MTSYEPSARFITKDFKLPYTLTKEFGNAKFGELYEKALLRKRLFKEYIMRNQVLEKLNQAIEAIYDCEVLPEDPMEFIIAHLKAPPPAPAVPRSPVGLRTSPAFVLSSGGGASPARQISPEHTRPAQFDAHLQRI